MVSNLLYQLARSVLGAASRIYFSRIDVLHPEWIPPRGPVLIVANHPASFTDVVVVAGAIPRQIHFLAMAPLFRPWIRGFALRLGGALPVYRRSDDPSLMHRNEDTFREVHALFERGGAVLIFPEGTSKTDRDIVPVKTGAARLALGANSELTLLPLGLHFTQRSSFRSSVVVSIGQPVNVAPFRAMATDDEPEAVRRLTDRIQGTLESLILHFDEADRRSLVEGIEQLYADELRAASPGSNTLSMAQGMAECVDYYARTDPARVVRGSQRIRSYQRELEAIGVADRAVREMLPPRGRLRERLRLFAMGLLGIVPALIGGVLHVVPYQLTARLGSLIGSDPTRLAAYRMALGIVFFPATYAALALLFLRGLHWPVWSTVVALVVIVLLGLHALIYFQWLSHQEQRLKLIALRIDQRRRIAQLQRERRELIRLFADAQDEWRARREEPVA